MNRSTLLVPGLVLALAAPAAPTAGQLSEDVVRSYLWPNSDADFARAAATLEADPSWVGLTRERMREVEEWMRRGPALDARGDTGEAVHRLMVDAPGGREVPVTVLLPSAYTPTVQWPLMLAMHGGPPGTVEGALRSSLNMISVWAESAEAAGWIVVSPAMVDVVSHDGRTQDRLPYEIFQPEEAKAVVDAVRANFSVDPDRIVSTGISLGSNFSIAYAAAHPDWFSAIVPVSTEGESREWLLRNLGQVPTYVLEGAQDQNIRGVGGPRAMDAIMKSFGYDFVYREFSDRAHEGFQEHYPDVLRWLAERPRPAAPREVLRMPHRGIVPPARRVHWVEADTRQALVRARVTAATEIDITTRWASELTLFLSDQLVDLDRPITIRVNGLVVFDARVERSARIALEEARNLKDERRVYSARVTVAVPDTPVSIATAVALTDELAPRHPEGTLSYWEMYAVRALEERFPTLGFTAFETMLPDGVATAPEQIGLRVREVYSDGAAASAGLLAGDVLVSFGGEPFFAGRDGTAGLYHWLVRELRTTPADYALVVLRAGRRVALQARYGLGPYRPPGA